jgi:hypothetical protein
MQASLSRNLDKKTPCWSRNLDKNPLITETASV